MAVTAACWGAGSAVLASSASAGGVDGGSGVLTAAVYNVTPYTWTLVQSSAFDQQGNAYALNRTPAATVAPGAGSLFALNSNYYLTCFGTWKYGYDSYFTYRVDPLGAPPEYLTVAITQLEVSYPTGCGQGGQHAEADVYITSAPPPPGYNPANAPGTPPAAVPSNPQIQYTHNSPYLFDQSFSVNGDWTVDAQSPLGVAFDDALNSICGGSNPNCSFTQTTPLVWGAGAPTVSGQSLNCSAPAPDSDPILFGTTYSAEQEATLSVGGGVSASTEADLFGVVGVKATVEVEAEHEWTEINSFERSAQVSLLPHETGVIWTAPEVGVVKGTLVLRTGSASFTVTNFYQTRSGVTKDDQTPAYDSITQIRDASAAEIKKFCPGSRASRAGRAAAAGSKAALIPGRGVAGVKLGQARNSQRLRRPLIKSPRANRSAVANDCRVLDPWCTMVAGRGGTWVYPDLSVVFGANRRVSALFYSGRGRSAEGVGVGSSPRAVRAAYPRATCETRMNCSLKSTYRSKAVKTVFHFITKKGRRTCDRVLVYFADERRGEMGA
jgi:hypothetical protein